MNVSGRRVRSLSTANRGQLAPDVADVGNGHFYACSDPENHLTSDYSRIANYVAERPEFCDSKKGKKNQWLIYMAAACGASFLRFSRRSTMHGLIHLAQARTIQRRFFWLCISIVALFGFFFNMFFLIEKYLQVPVLTNVLHDADNFMFPDVTFCTINPIYFPPEGTPEFKRMTAAIEDFEKFQKSDNEFARRLALADYLFIERNTYYVHPKWLTIVQCHYMQTRCSSDHFEERIIWPYGACYTFNATKMERNMSREVSTRTRYNRIRPDLRIIVYKALDLPQEYQIDPHDDLEVPSGILLMIHEPGTYPHIGHSIVVDECSQIELRMTSVKHLTKLGKCVPSKEYISYVNAATNESQLFITGQSDCLDAEVQEALAKHCGCQMHTIPVMYKHHHLPFCFSGALEVSFLEKCFAKISANADRKYCFLDVCEHFTIDRVIAHTKFPAVQERHTHLHWLRLLEQLEEKEKAQYNGKSDLAKLALKADFTANPNLTIRDVVKSGNKSLLDPDFVNRNFMMLRVVPASLFMDRVEETEEYPFSRLLSDIGGCVGLWVGASLITLFEFADLILDFMDLGNIGFPNFDQIPSQGFQENSKKCNVSKEKPTDEHDRGNPMEMNSPPPSLSELPVHEPPLENLSDGSHGSSFAQNPPDVECKATSVQMIPLFYLTKLQNQEQDLKNPSVTISFPM
ncbi:hypothetical protein Aperf_G00000008687 [Anoplocephala perfoliata]